MAIEVNLKNLNNAWVVVKKYNGNIYFKTDYCNDSKNPDRAKIYYDQAHAQKRMDDANFERKKCKYYLEPAAMHFVNRYEFGIEYWGDKPYIRNVPLALTTVKKEGKYTKITKEIFHQKLNEDITSKIKEKEARIEDALKTYTKEIENLKQMKEQFQNFDIEKIDKEYGTKAEITAQILYGVK